MSGAADDSCNNSETVVLFTKALSLSLARSLDEK